MATTWQSVHVRCPFYRSDGEREISCEGLWPGTTLTVTRFRAPRQTLEHMQRLCMSRYTQCRLYSRIEEKYEDKLEPAYTCYPQGKRRGSPGSATSGRAAGKE